MPRLLRAIATVLLYASLQTSSSHAQASADTYPDGIAKTTNLPPVSWSIHQPKLRIVLAGASTVQPGSGWGPGFVASLKPGVDCLNLSKGERSSRTYREEGRWDQAFALKPDYIIVGFANNDSMKSRPQRFVELEDFKVNTARFVSEARAAGIKPILMTAMSAHRWNADSSLKPNGEPAPCNQIIRDVAKEMHVPLLDVEHITAAYYAARGKVKIDALSPIKDGAVEGQHLNKDGGMVIGRVLATVLKSQNADLAPYIQ